MSSHLQRAIDKLMAEVIGLSALVEDSVKLAVQSIEERDIDLAKKVVEEDRIIDAKEIDIEEECLKIFALHQPVAIDLRYLVAVLKINNDLERIGDLSQNIAKHSIKILSDPIVVKPVKYQEICNKVQRMVKMSLDALVNLDLSKAKEILKADNEVDQLNHELYNKVLKEIEKTPQHAHLLIQYSHIARHLERIADHATNIAEDIIYLIEGEIVRHSLKI
jgi:phosphate transport system protein